MIRLCGGVANPKYHAFEKKVISSRKIHDAIACIYLNMAIISLHFLLLTVEVIALGHLLIVLLLSQV